jgi:RNA polymerase sigma-70 factor, ECF subfamily
MESETNDITSYVTIPDEILLSRSIHEPEVFEVLVQRYELPFLQAARRILGSEDAEDAVQETFVRMYIHAPKYVKRDGIKFSSWAYAILVRVCYTIYAKNKKKSTFTLDLEVTNEIEDFSISELREYGFDKEYLVSLISKLPSLLKRTLELYVFDHKSEKEIARIEGVSYGVIRTRMSRAKDKLKELNLKYSKSVAQPIPQKIANKYE